MKKDLLSVSDLTRQEAEALIEEALRMKKEGAPLVLAGKTLALLFEKPSLRTKVSFQLAMHQLGGHSIYLAPEEVGLGRREPVADVARVLSRYVDGITARTFAQGTLLTLADRSSIPVINALSDAEHPCQALADLLTVYEKKGRFSGLTLAYVGDGNNVANSLLLAACLVGIDFHCSSPAGYTIAEEVLSSARDLAAGSGSHIRLTDSAQEAARDADVLYTDVWTSMGQEAEAEKRRGVFAPYRVDEGLLGLARDDVLFMHPLPAHPGEEIVQGLLDDRRSVVFDQAENRLHLQKALLARMLKPRP